jgi:hypothetical protein
MGAFLSISAAFAGILLLKASGAPLFEYSCLGTVVVFSPRLLLPFYTVFLGYIIYILEGVQSSVMLANKQSTESLAQTVANIDMSNRDRERATRTLAPCVNHAAIDNFVVGRQLLIVACGFLFKFAYDASSLNSSELETLQRLSQSCPISSAATLAAYRVFDHWLFSAVFCSILVAYVFQVTAKLMAQNFPMRFLTVTWLAIYVVPVATWIGRRSGLAIPLQTLRDRGDRRNAEGNFSFFSSKKEIAPIDTQQSYSSLARLIGESVAEISIELSEVNHKGRTLWLVRLRAISEVVAPSRVFRHLFQADKHEELEFTVMCKVPNGEMEPNNKALNQLRLVSEIPKREEVHINLQCRFGSVIPVERQVIWDVKYFMPICGASDGQASFAQLTFDVPILQPVRKVTFYVEEGWSSDPEVVVLPIDGVQPPKIGTVENGCANGRRFLSVSYPAFGSRLQFRF